MRLSRSLVLVTLALALALGAACVTTDEPPSFTPVADPPFLPERDPDIRGAITKVMPESGDKRLRILVEAGDQKDVVTIKPETRIYRDEAGKLRDAAAGDLRQGVRVEAWYDGAVRESYPRQANADAVVITSGR